MSYLAVRWQEHTDVSGVKCRFHMSPKPGAHNKKKGSPDKLQIRVTQNFSLPALFTIILSVRHGACLAFMRGVFIQIQSHSQGLGIRTSTRKSGAGGHSSALSRLHVDHACENTVRGAVLDSVKKKDGVADISWLW